MSEKVKITKKQEVNLWGGLVDVSLLETIYDPDENVTRFAVSETKGNKVQIRVTDSFETEDGRCLRPVPANIPLIANGLTILPPCVGDKRYGDELLDKIQSILHAYMDMDPLYERLAARYVLFTWFYDIFNKVQYLRVTGDAGSGKTRFLEVVGALCYRPVMVNGGQVTNSGAVYRAVDAVRGTLVLDEADFTKNDLAISGILNTGDRRLHDATHNLFGPKIFATRGEYTDYGLAGKCLTFNMHGHSRAIPLRLPDTFWSEEVPALQAELLHYRLAYWHHAMFSLACNLVGQDRYLATLLQFVV